MRAVDCGDTVQANAYLTGTPSNYQQGATTTIMCNSGYIWVSGSYSTSAKSASCQNVNGNGVWTSNDTCIGTLNFVLQKPTEFCTIENFNEYLRA